MTTSSYNYAAGVTAITEELNKTRKSAGFWPVIDGVFTLIYIGLLVFLANSSTLWYSLFHIFHVWIWSIGIPLSYTAFNEPIIWFFGVLAAALLFDIIILIIRTILEFINGPTLELFFIIVNIMFIILDCLNLAFTVNLYNSLSEYYVSQYRKLSTSDSSKNK